MPVPAVGDNVRVVEKAKSSDTKVVTEGVVTAVDEANNRLDFDIARTKLSDTANVNVRVEIVLPPLPSTPGSVVTANGGIFFLTESGWVSEGGGSVRQGYIEAQPWTLIHDATA